MNGEHFAVMAGTGFDARMIGMVDGAAKRRLGRAAYVWSGLKAARAKPMTVKIDTDESPWFSGDATCLLIANVPKVIGGMEVFPRSDTPRTARSKSVSSPPTGSASGRRC